MASPHPMSDVVPPAHAPEVSQRDFARVRAIMRTTTGIELAPDKQGFVRSRLARRLRALHVESVASYLDWIEGDRDELAAMIDALTTNKTEFFREHAHFALLQRELPALAARRAEVRIWSAGCATGEEPYSIAITAREALGVDAARVRILATDLSTRALAVARTATYGTTAVRRVPGALRERFLVTAHRGDDAEYHVQDAIRRMVRFARLNLVGSWPMRRAFDVIFCRNVMIYFGREVQQALVTRLARQLAPGGLLLLGHSESLSGVEHELAYVRPATYRKDLHAH